MDAHDLNAAAAAIGATLARWARLEKEQPTEDDNVHAERRREVVEELSRILSPLPAELQGPLVAGLVVLDHASHEALRGPSDYVEDEADLLLRRAHLDLLREQYETGARPWIWPPPAGTEWDEIRVLTGLYMERRRDDWPEVAYSTRGQVAPLSPFLSAVQTAQMFVQAWLLARTHEDLVEFYGPDEATVWLDYLELPRLP